MVPGPFHNKNQVTYWSRRTSSCQQISFGSYIPRTTLGWKSVLSVLNMYSMYYQGGIYCRLRSTIYLYVQRSVSTLTTENQEDFFQGAHLYCYGFLRDHCRRWAQKIWWSYDAVLKNDHQRSLNSAEVQLDFFSANGHIISDLSLLPPPSVVLVSLIALIALASWQPAGQPCFNLQS